MKLHHKLQYTKYKRMFCILYPGQKWGGQTTTKTFPSDFLISQLKKRISEVIYDNFYLHLSVWHYCNVTAKFIVLSQLRKFSKK